MPTYDFVCRNCEQRFDVFMTFSEYGKRKVKCTNCGSTNVRRRMTRVRVARSEESRLDSLADESALDGLENDPRALGQMMKKMGREVGEDLPPEFDDMADRLEAGQSPEEIESALPDLAGDSDASSGMDDDL
ncbi:MAG TPA: zinc ribbon domain-containing protein [Anaerolineales bacterium]|nr:zinc ribbon domain-containing protein [Anaerolineales bacterium]